MPKSSTKSRQPKTQTRKANHTAAKHAPEVPSASTPKQTTYSQTEQECRKAVHGNKHASETTKKYDTYFKAAQAYVKEVARSEQGKAEAWSSHQAESPVPENEIDDSAACDKDSSAPEESAMDPQFGEAFDGPPKSCTPDAIEQFLWYKCFKGNCKIGVANIVHAAMISHYDELAGDRYRGSWEYDQVTNTAKGNPARSAKVADMMKSIKNKDGQPERNHSKAMSYDDMVQLYQFIISICPSKDAVDAESLRKRGELLFFLALASLGFVVWTRNSEARKLQFKHLDFTVPPKRTANGQTHPRFTLNLRNRKNWQNKMESGDLDLEGHVYNIYPQERTPAIDFYHHLLEWREFYQTHLLGESRPIIEDDYVFPTINFSKLTVTPDTPVVHQTVQKMILEVATSAGLSHPERYKTHCFRRGGSQHRFMLAPIGERWTMTRIRWWGGWAEGESNVTLLRYLVDELCSYEQGHGDALCPGEEPAEQSHMGENRETRLFTVADGQALYAQCNDAISRQLTTFSEKLVAQIKPESKVSSPMHQAQLPLQPSKQAAWDPYTGAWYAADPFQHPPMPAALLPAANQVTFYPPSPPNVSPLCPNLFLPSQPPYYQQPPLPQIPIATPTARPSVIFTQPPSMTTAGPSVTCAQPPSTTTAGPSVTFAQPPSMTTAGPSVTFTQPPSTTQPPKMKYCVPRISRKHKADGWQIVISDWETPQPSRCPVPLRDWDSRWFHATKQEQLYHTRKVIALEFIEAFNRDADAFCTAYPEHKKGISHLFKAITKVHQAKGTANTRAKRVVSVDNDIDMSSDDES